MSADPTLNHEAVKAYRDHFRFCPNLGTRNDIIATVTDLKLWKEVLTSWGYWKDGKWKKFNPLNARAMMQEYERRERVAKTERGGRDCSRNDYEDRPTRAEESWDGYAKRLIFGQR